MPSLVLVGGGHAHVEVLRRLAQAPPTTRPPFTSLTLITPSRTSPYSGMLPGVIEGLYAPGDALIDVAALAAAVPGGRVLLGTAVSVDTRTRVVSVEEPGSPPGRARAVPYDVVSFDVGAAPGWGGVPGAARWATPVKPVATLLGRVEAVVEGRGAAAGGCGGGHPVAVVGGGAGGVEVAAAMAVRLKGGVVLVCGGRLLGGAPARATDAVARRLGEVGVEVLVGARVVRVETGGGGGGVVLTLADGGGATSTLDASACLWCTGAAGPGWLGGGPAPPPLTPGGFLAVNTSMASSDDPASPLARVFGAGDCAAVVPHPRPKAGVWAVRQGPPLTEALLAACAGAARPPSFTPQTRALALLSVGRRSAVGIVPVPGSRAASVVVEGRWVWAWKDWIDRAFVRRYRV